MASKFDYDTESLLGFVITQSGHVDRVNMSLLQSSSLQFLKFPHINTFMTLRYEVPGSFHIGLCCCGAGIFIASF